MDSNSPLKKSVSESSGATAGLSSSVFPGVSPRTAGQASSGTLFQRAAKLGLACGVCVVAVAIIGGCGPGGIERAVLSGTVTYQGQPVKKGVIRFIPIKGTKGPSWGAHIIDGRYKAAGKGGVPVGTHKVEILAYRPKAAAPPPGREPDTIPPEQYIPDKYNAKSVLEITIPPGSGKVVENFDLTD